MMKSIPPIADDDWERPLTDEEIGQRMKRVGGGVTCPECGNLYYDHPMETRVLGFDDRPFLHRLCNGWLGKL